MRGHLRLGRGLVFLRADQPRLLIAYDVGAGSTIEAGLVLEEFQTRRDRAMLLVLLMPRAGPTLHHDSGTAPGDARVLGRRNRQPSTRRPARRSGTQSVVPAACSYAPHPGIPEGACVRLRPVARVGGLNGQPTTRSAGSSAGRCYTVKSERRCHSS
jgi:hypothetical protein